MIFQTTLKQPVLCSGVGLHTGLPTHMTIRPAVPDTGIVFIRRDVEKEVRIRAHIDNVSDATLATTISQEGVKVSTVEHLMAAFAGLGVDNAEVELDAPEVPIMDGSSGPFNALLKNAGVRVQDRSKKFIIVKHPVTVTDGDRQATFLPSNDFKLSYTIDFRHPLISNQFYLIQISNGNFEREICRARTFGFLREYETLKARGFARGGSLENAVVVGESGVLNEGGLRFADEFVRHKILDSIGDLWLMGAQVIGHFIGYKSGHTLNHKLIHKLLSHKEWFDLREFSSEEEVRSLQINPPTH
ncbi:MAG: UDP-3-O-acyl-N-acetylglucosamine deacetylase [Deltaproteobacteria bacterium]|jgi:UDP-3-O-[3-hydroxymyristoyl] N-acetylglucosamine deacetylase|nr:UDP-3-O-acyl-N-acetylglucosamine deacetylase [Deltaproteobacteria bacterium]